MLRRILALLRAVPRKGVHDIAYALFACLCILVMARLFYGEMMAQTGGEWSAPLDDVFIHFDYARATARGYPFQWSEGNGYSTGNTSLTYPFALALGYWVGFRGPALMLWAAIVACCCVLAYLLAVRRLAVSLPRPAALVLPVAVLSVGALCWSLFSGMEVAFFLGVWAVGLSGTLDFRYRSLASASRRAWFLGLAGALLVATRPEGATSVAVLGFAAGWFVWRRSRSRSLAVATIARVGVPGIVFLLLQALANKLLTGTASAAGAVVKLAINNPFMTAQEMWNEYKFLIKYCVLRNLEHHFTSPDGSPYGWIPVILATVALLSRRTRAAAALLLASAIAFLLLVALNGQVRWQNERYTMPAVAWLLTAAGLGLGVLLTRARHDVLSRKTWIPRATAGIALVVAFAIHQLPNMKDQIWFFGRASRNIRDQHTIAGRILRNELVPTPHRVLVGDAGALMYASDLPGLDIIGLGGYKRLPFARASVHGLGATIELIERMPPEDRPDVMAIFPTWWGILPVWFGHLITSVWVDGNVICGGAEKAIYRADWRLLGTGATPATLRKTERIVDELDVADLVSEDDHAYRFPRPQAGFVDMRILADPVNPSRDVFDAGRRIPEGRSESFELVVDDREVHAARLIVRTAPVRTGHVEVQVDDRVLGTIDLAPSQGFVELSIDVPALPDPRRPLKFRLTPRDTVDWVNYHVWLVARP